MTRLTEAQRLILLGLSSNRTHALSATEAVEAACLEELKLVEIFDFCAEIGSGQHWWIPVWRITELGRSALARANKGGGDA